MTGIFPSFIRFVSEAPFSDIEPYAQEITGEIFICDDNDEQALAGRIRLFYIDIGGMINEGYSLYDVLDMQAATAEYMVLFEGDSCEYSEIILSSIGDDPIGLDLLILDRLQIFPPYRGQELAIPVIFRTIQQYGHGCKFAVMKPFPLQFEAGVAESEWYQEMEMESFEQNEEQALDKLRSYYLKMGFAEVKGTPFLALNLALKLKIDPFRGC